MNEYELYLQKIAELERLGLTPKVYGKTLLGQPLYYYKLSKRVDFRQKPLKILVQAGIHAREFVTTFLVFRLIEHCNIQIYRELSKLHAAKRHPYLQLNYELYFVPNTNVDGFRICTEGLSFLSEKPQCAKGAGRQHCGARRKQIADTLLELNLGNKDFSLWKANARGVDLNVNFDARFGTGSKNTRQFGAENCTGDAPLSEPETRALVELTNKIKPDLTISYHSKGQEIYYQFYQDSQRLERDKTIAQAIARTTKYNVADVSGTSAGGYKDYCIEKLKIPAFTIEVGDDALSHPLKLSNLKQIYKENKNVIHNILKYYSTAHK